MTLLAAVAPPQHLGAQSGAPQAPASNERRVSLDASDLTLSLLIDQLVRTHGLTLRVRTNVDLGKTVQNIYLKDVSLESALATLLSPYGYSFGLDGQVLEIYARTTKTFRVRVPMVLQSWQTVMSNEAQGAGSPGSGGSGSSMASGLGAQIAVSARTDSTGLWDEIERGVKALVGEKGTFTVSRVAGIVTVTDIPEVLEAVERFVVAINTELARQALVEVRIIEVSLSDEKRAGVDWNVVFNDIGVNRINPVSLATPFGATAIGEQAMAFSVSSVNGSAVLRAVQRQGEVNVVAQPSLVVSNNLPGIIQVGEIQTFVNKLTVTQTANVGTQASVETDILTDGLTLGLLPRINEGGAVMMGVSVVVQDILSVSRVDFFGGFVELPLTSRRSYAGVNEVENDTTLVIGGLLSDRAQTGSQGVPLLSELPILGILFGAQSNEKERVELVIMLTVRPVIPTEAPEKPFFEPPPGAPARGHTDVQKGTAN